MKMARRVGVNCTEHANVVRAICFFLLLIPITHSSAHIATPLPSIPYRFSFFSFSFSFAFFSSSLLSLSFFLRFFLFVCHVLCRKKRVTCSFLITTQSVYAGDFSFFSCSLFPLCKSIITAGACRSSQQRKRSLHRYRDCVRGVYVRLCVKQRGVL